MLAKRLGLACGFLAVHALCACGGDDGPGGITTARDGGGEHVDGSRPNVGSVGGGSRPRGSVGGSSTAPIPPSLSRNDRIADLMPAEASELCEALDAELSAAVTDDDAQRLSCTLLALFSSLRSDGAGGTLVDRLQCDEAFADCLSSSGSTTATSDCDAASLASAAAGCPTTVGDFADCARGSAQQLARAVDTFNCAAFSNPAVIDAALAGPMDIPECTSVQTECPALLGGSPSGGPSGEPPASGCENTCTFRDDAECDDGGPGMVTNFCVLGTDCNDCGPR